MTLKILPSYVGSKAYWINHLEQFRGKSFVELFAGSSVLSFNLASECILNDKDPYIYKILSKFDKLIVPDIFTIKDYFEKRTLKDWWKYTFCFQKMSFSGVFRYSKNGYNVPPKKIDSIRIKDEYRESLKRWKKLKPTVTCFNYNEFPMSKMENSVVIIDPPYENSKASYNSKNSIDYHLYWEFIRICEGVNCIMIVFDDHKNIPFDEFKTRGMAVNGLHKKSKEGMFIFENTLEVGKQGEDIFHKYNPTLERADGMKFDFLNKDKKKIELKSDYYDMEKTSNFFIERFSHGNKDGGPWQSFINNVDYYVYFFVKNKKCFIFDTKKLVIELSKIEHTLELSTIGNDGYETRGYKVNRDLIKESLVGVKSYE